MPWPLRTAPRGTARTRGRRARASETTSPKMSAADIRPAPAPRRARTQREARGGDRERAEVVHQRVVPQRSGAARPAVPGAGREQEQSMPRSYARRHNDAVKVQPSACEEAVKAAPTRYRVGAGRPAGSPRRARSGGTGGAPGRARSCGGAARRGRAGGSRRRCTRAPHLAQEHAVGEQLALVAREHPEQVELVRRQVDRLAVDA